MNKRIPRDTCKIIQLTQIINKSITLGKNVHLNTYQKTGGAGGKLIIGDYSNFAGDNTFYIHDDYKISFGKFCSIAGGASFIASVRHDYTCLTTYTYEFVPKNFKSVGKNISIGHDVRIGRNAIILKGVTIGIGAIIGAGAVVTKDIPPYAIAVGNPAKVTKYRFDDKTIKKLLESERWNWDTEEILKNYNLEFLN